MTTKSTNFRTIFWYGERFYSATEVDAELRRTSSQLTDVRSNIQMIRALYNSSNYWTAIANAGTPKTYIYNEPSFIEPESDTAPQAVPTEVPTEVLPEMHQAENSPRSSCGSSSSNTRSNNGYGCGARGRAIGKRNQEFYIPHGVILSHTTAVHTDNESEDEYDEWFGRYDKHSNKIIRTVNCANGTNADNDNDIDEYETLKHFAQEHDRAIVMWQMCQAHKGVQEYRECNTPNVWTNPLFKFYNTVSLNWEPLSALRNDTGA
jgi:hypothetical protein